MHCHRNSNNILAGLAGADALDGGSGIDTADYSASASGVTVNLATGTASGGDAAGDTLVNIENVTGSASNDTLIGDSNANTLNGWVGSDAMAGGLGNDVYYVNVAGDTVTEYAGEGLDTVRSSIAYTLGDNVENLVLTSTGNINGTGNSLDNVITGNTGANTLSGGIGNDTLNGGAGVDTLLGGTGNDTYVIDDATDTATESAGEGTDTVQSSITYTLGSEVENLTLTGTSAINGAGNDLDNAITGNSGVNTLTGGAGNDLLNGGAGADTMAGGTGNDTYVVDDVGDVVTESTGEGIDTVQTSALNYTLGADLENLTITGSSNRNGFGNSLANTIIGNSATNTLAGLGGADVLDGGDGVDTASYVASASGVTVSLATGTGTGGDAEGDTLANIENLTGSAFSDTLTGDSGNNTLDGKAGADTLVGGAGDDIYTVDNAGDVAVENAGEGTDKVQSSVNQTLSANIENLTLLGTGDRTGTGNASNNIVVGNTGNNTLSGQDGDDTLDGGAGNDTLVGGAGTDIYLFGSGGGQDAIINGVSGNSGPSGELRLGANIAVDQVWFQQSGNDLVAMLMGSQDRVTISGWYANNYSQLSAVKAADGQQVDTGLAQLVQAMATYSAQNSGFDPTASAQAPTDPTLQSAIAAAWN